MNEIKQKIKLTEVAFLRKFQKVEREGGRYMSLRDAIVVVMTSYSPDKKIEWR